MGYKGTLRSIGSAVNAWERESRRKQRELERQQKQMDKMQELDRAAYEVKVYENYLDVISSVHKECSETKIWQEIETTRPPLEPKRSNAYEQTAIKELEDYMPSFFDKTFKKVGKKKNALLKKLEDAKGVDNSEYKEKLDEYKDAYNEWQVLNKIATRICEGDIDAYPDAIKFL